MQRCNEVLSAPRAPDCVDPGGRRAFDCQIRAFRTLHNGRYGKSCPSWASPVKRGAHPPGGGVASVVWYASRASWDYAWLLDAYLDRVRELEASGRVPQGATRWIFVLPALHLIRFRCAIQKRRAKRIFARHWWGLQHICHACSRVHVLGRIRDVVVYDDEVQVGLLFVQPAIKPLALRFAVWANNFRCAGN